MLLRAILPKDHLSAESKDVVKLGTGMIATMAALVLGLLIASAKGSFDTMSIELRQTGSRFVLLDRAFSAAGSLFLILELDNPYEGLIKVSSGPRRNALALLSQ